MSGVKVDGRKFGVPEEWAEVSADGIGEFCIRGRVKEENGVRGGNGPRTSDLLLPTRGR